MVGEGEGGSLTGQERGGGNWFFIESPTGGGGSRRGRCREGVCGELGNFGGGLGGGLIFFFRGRNVHQISYRRPEAYSVPRRTVSQHKNVRNPDSTVAQEVLRPLRGLGIRPLVSAIRGLGNPLPGPLRAPEKALRGPGVVQGPRSGVSGDRKWCRQTGSQQSPPPSTIRTRYGNSVSTPEATRTGKTQQNSLCKREADTEFQYRPHIVDTDIDCGRHFCGHHFRDSYPKDPGEGRPSHLRVVSPGQRLSTGMRARALCGCICCFCM